MRRILLATLIAAVVVVGSLSMDAEIAEAKVNRAYCGFRWASSLDDVEDAIDRKLPGSKGRLKRGLKRLQKRFRRCPNSLPSEMSLARELVLFVKNGLIDSPDAELERLMELVADDYEPIVEGRIEDADAFILRLAANGNKTQKAEKRLAKAKKHLARGRRPRDYYQRIFSLRLALLDAGAATRGIKVVNPPKSCEGRRLKKKEHCEVVLSNRALAFNLGEAEIGRNAQDEIISVSVRFAACNGKDVDLERFSFQLDAPFTGTHDISTDAGNGRGSYRRGLGFASSLRSPSQVTINHANLAAGYIEGTFEFRTNSVIGRNGRFLILSAK